MASWDATGLLEPLWGKVGGRDRLAALTHIQPATLSGYNTGRLKLGTRNAEKIAAALEVSLADLGAPEAAAADDPTSRPLLDRLQALEAALEQQREDSARALAALAKEVRALRRQRPGEGPAPSRAANQ
jgi:DNA-binding transcriptional regulator YdaS (Cro superfamily)